MLAFLLIAIGGSVTQPKIAIQTPPNMQLEAYQNQDDPVEIVTPPARTEKLDGFTPLKKE